MTEIWGLLNTDGFDIASKYRIKNILDGNFDWK